MLAPCPMDRAAEMPMVGMGEIVLLEGVGRAHAVLGSCVAVVLQEADGRPATLAHVVLPAANGRGGAPGKFADTAITQMCAQLTRAGARVDHLIAKIAGGANMFGQHQGYQVGQENIAAVQRLLRERGILLAAQHIGGSKGRRVVFDSRTGRLSVQVQGEDTATL